MTDAKTLHLGYKNPTDVADRSYISFCIKAETSPLELDTFTPNDASALHRIYSDEENVKHDLSAAGPDSFPAVEVLVASWTNLADPITLLPLVVVAKGEVIGIGGMGHI